jgi:hypothetical protein
MKVISTAVALAALSAQLAVAQTPPPSNMALRGGAMTVAQFQARQRRQLMRADTDHDGRISLAEWTTWRAAHPGHGDPARMFQRLDANHDGYITPDEVDALSARRFARMDVNHDGVVTPDERRAARPAGEETVQPLSPQ